ncbi:MAG: hypothetical protein HY716_00995 [Planctomycetes bacterium]|nr:hypothetical protein [Planctomycetota bacterium]
MEKRLTKKQIIRILHEADAEELGALFSVRYVRPNKFAPLPHCESGSP